VRSVNLFVSRYFEKRNRVDARAEKRRIVVNETAARMRDRHARSRVEAGGR